MSIPQLQALYQLDSLVYQASLATLHHPAEVTHKAHKHLMKKTMTQYHQNLTVALVPAELTARHNLKIE